MFKKETKLEQTEKKSSASSVVTTTKTFSFTSTTQNKSDYQAASRTTQQNTILTATNRSDLFHNIRGNSLDQATYKALPPRSAFTSAPLTTKPNFFNKNVVDAKPFNVKPTVPVPLPKPQSSLISPINTNAQCNNINDLLVKLIVNVKKSEKFRDDQNSIVPVYRTRSKHRGRLLLINNIKYADGKEVRKGAKLDEINVCELFKQLGFEVVKHTDLSKKDVMAKVTAFRKDKLLGKVDIGAVIVMSHGTGRERSDSTEIACTDGELLPTTWIINEFDNIQCPQLDGKPKIFIFQCCRGDRWDIQYDVAPLPVSRKLCDMLIGYATVPGFVAHRDPVKGTWYIQAICKVFMEHAHDNDVESLLKIVDSKLSRLITDHGSKQTTSFENRGFKTCYLHPKLWEK